MGGLASVVLNCKTGTFMIMILAFTKDDPEIQAILYCVTKYVKSSSVN